MTLCEWVSEWVCCCNVCSMKSFYNAACVAAAAAAAVQGVVMTYRVVMGAGSREDLKTHEQSEELR